MHCAGAALWVGLARELLQHRVHAPRTTRINDAIEVRPDDALHASGTQDASAGSAGGADAGDADADALDRLVDDLQCVEQRRQHDYSGAMLVVMEDGYVQLVAQALL